MDTKITHQELTHKLNTLTIIVGGLIIIAAIAAIAFSWTFSGIALIIIGFGYYFIKSKQEIYGPTGSVVKRYSCYFDKDIMFQMEKVVNGNISELSQDIKLSFTGSGRIDVVVSHDKEFFATRLFGFVPHSYEPDTDVIVHTGAKAKEISTYIEKCKKAI